VRGITPEARALIGFWLRTGSPTPRKTLSSWAKEPDYADRFWGPRVPERIAASVEKIRHWRILEGNYAKSAEIEATWFIDPPYHGQGSGRAYAHGSNAIDYPALARWVQERKGSSSRARKRARALPFRHFVTAKANRAKRLDGVSNEVVYVTRSAGEKPARSDVDQERIGAVLRALGVEREAIRAMLAARTSTE
jgi:hypothetical protein